MTTVWDDFVWDDHAMKVIEGSVPIEAPPIPGDGPIVYINGGGEFMIVARLSPGEALATIWSWRIGDDFWVRNYAC